jgi:hypothetical protein
VVTVKPEVDSSGLGFDSSRLGLDSKLECDSSGVEFDSSRSSAPKAGSGGSSVTRARLGLAFALIDLVVTGNTVV